MITNKKPETIDDYAPLWRHPFDSIDYTQLKKNMENKFEWNEERVKDFVYFSVSHIFAKENIADKIESDLLFFKNSVMVRVHPKKELMTEDGYDEKLGFWPVETDGFTMGGFHEGKPRNFDRNFYKTFHKKENAEKYIEENKPVFSKKEIKDALEDLYMLSDNSKQGEFIRKIKNYIGL